MAESQNSKGPPRGFWGADSAIGVSMWAMLLVCPNHPDGDLALLSDAEFPDQNSFVGPFEA